MNAVPENWRNCTMYVQDLVRPHVNVTADVPIEAIGYFKNLCNKLSRTA